MKAGLTIGSLAKAAGVNVETIRYYERRRLLDQPDKPQEGSRRYSVDQTKRVRFIKRAQALGFTLAEVGQLLTLSEGCTCKTTRALAVLKLGLIEEKISGLIAMRQALSELVQDCNANREPDCPIIDALTRE